jgi:uncharacterized delta-60 repeat protein
VDKIDWRWTGQSGAHFAPAGEIEARRADGIGKASQATENQNMRTTLILSSVVLASIGGGAFAAPGDLDPTFGVGGIVLTDVSTTTDIGKAIAIQADGRIIVAGNKQTGADLLLVRYNDDGSVDPSFNATGRVVVASVGVESGSAVVVQPDGKIIVAGGTTDFTLVRFNSNGTLDGTFGTAGKVTTAIGLGGDSGTSMALQADGKIIVAGGAANPVTYDFAVARYNANGTLDPAFNNGLGKVTTDFGGLDDFGKTVAMQSDGKIVVAGYTTVVSPTFGNVPLVALARYNPDGTLDKTLNGTGKVALAVGDFSEANAIRIQGDGKILVVGYSRVVASTVNRDFLLLRFNPNGTLDSAFGDSGQVITDFAGFGDIGKGVAIQADGKIVVAGPAYDSTGNTSAGVSRYNPNGSLDSTFGNAGKVKFLLGGDGALGMALQQDGRIAVTSYAGSDFHVSRFQAHPFVAEIAVEQPPGNGLANGTASVAFGSVLTGSNASLAFTVRNLAAADLTGLGITLDGPNASDFTITASPSAPVAAGGSSTFTVRFAPAIAGTKSAVLHIASNDSDESPFDITLTGRALTPNADDDGDGVTNEAELNLSGQGFDPLSDSSLLRALVHDNALGLGLYRASDVQALALGSPLLERDAGTGHFLLSIGVEKSADLITWTPLLGFAPSFNPATGRITLDFAPGADNAQFYRVLGSRP